jgi:hypothetical protein
MPTCLNKEMTGIVSITWQMTNDHTTITNAASYSMREESILIIFTWTRWFFLHAYTGLLVNTTMIALFACRRLDQNGNGGANADNNKSWPKSLIVSDYGRIRYYNRILLKFGCTPITNVISNTYCTVSIIPYWELKHRANPNIHRTPRWFALVATCKSIALTTRPYFPKYSCSTRFSSWDLWVMSLTSLLCTTEQMLEL